MRGRLFLFGVLLSSCSEPGRPVLNGCTYASDCAEGESCTTGTCVPVSQPMAAACSIDADCSADAPHCDAIFGACRECTSNAHCPTEWTCDRGSCVDQRPE